MQKITLYAAAAIINELFKNEEIDRTIMPQRLYNYASKGTLGRWEVEIDDDKRVDVASVKVMYDKIKSGSRTKSNAKAFAAMIMNDEI